MRQFFLHLYNAVDFPLRRFFRWHRKGFHGKNQDKTNLFSDLPPDQIESTRKRASLLTEQFHMQSLYAASTRKIYQINLYYLELLERSACESAFTLPKSIHALDVGCSDWFYVHALYRWLQWHESISPRLVNLIGYEVDAYRVYRDFYSCLDYARWYSRDLEGTHYIPEAFTGESLTYNMAFLFFPFIYLADHQDWGLPDNLFKPRSLLQLVWESLIPGGMLLIVNQGREEHELQVEAMKSMSIPIRTAFKFESNFFPYKKEHFVITAIR